VADIMVTRWAFAEAGRAIHVNTRLAEAPHSQQDCRGNHPLVSRPRCCSSSQSSSRNPLRLGLNTPGPSETTLSGCPLEEAASGRNHRRGRTCVQRWHAPHKPRAMFGILIARAERGQSCVAVR
jgi:hypothetical protein